MHSQTSRPLLCPESIHFHLPCNIVASLQAPHNAIFLLPPVLAPQIAGIAGPACSRTNPNRCPAGRENVCPPIPISISESYEYSNQSVDMDVLTDWGSGSAGGAPRGSLSGSPKVSSRVCVFLFCLQSCMLNVLSPSQGHRSRPTRPEKSSHARQWPHDAPRSASTQQCWSASQRLCPPNNQ